MTQFDKLDRGPWDSARRSAAARTGVAMADGSYPCENRQDVANAVATAHQHDAPQVGASPKSPFLEQAAKIQHRLRLAKGTGAPAAIVAEIAADTRKLAGDLGAVEAFRRSQRAPISCLKIGA
jgi:hypothetical protein